MLFKILLLLVVIVVFIYGSYVHRRNTKLTNAPKEAIIAKALETDEGRRALAEAMIAPIKDGATTSLFDARFKKR